MQSNAMRVASEVQEFHTIPPARLASIDRS